MCVMKEFLMCIDTAESSVNKALESRRFKKLQTIIALCDRDVDNPGKEDVLQLGEKFSFHQLNLDDCPSKSEVPIATKRTRSGGFKGLQAYLSH